MALLKMMEAFAVVVETWSFTKAGEQLGVSRSCVSKLIASLEKYLGFAVLYRTTGSVSLTEAGRLYYVGACRTLASARKAQADVLAMFSDQSAAPEEINRAA
jgi:LysR family transcriptional regulator, transcriptional activator for aaeXAB operon